MKPTNSNFARTLVTALVALAGATALIAPTSASAEPPHRRGHQVCHWDHHHKVCHWVR